MAKLYSDMAKSRLAFIQWKRYVHERAILNSGDLARERCAELAPTLIRKILGQNSLPYPRIF